MRKIVFILSALCLLTVSACQEKGKNEADSVQTTVKADSIQTEPAVSEWAFDTLSVKKKVHLNDDPTKNAMSVDLSFQYPISCPDKAILPTLQASFCKIFLNDANITISNPKKAFDKELSNFIAEAKGLAADWDGDGDDSDTRFSYFELSKWSFVSYQSKYLLSVSSTFGSYTGGAHGSYHLSITNIDTRDGKIITEADFFKNNYSEKLAKLIQSKVEARNASINEDDHISLLVEISEIKPNNNFCFEGKNLVFIYNQYEIAPYVQGPVPIEIPLKEIKSLVKDKYLPIIESIEQEQTKITTK